MTALARTFSATLFLLCFLAMLVFGASVGISIGGVIENGWEFSWLMLGLFVVSMAATARTWERAKR